VEEAMSLAVKDEEDILLKLRDVIKDYIKKLGKPAFPMTDPVFNKLYELEDAITERLKQLVWEAYRKEKGIS